MTTRRGPHDLDELLRHGPPSRRPPQPGTRTTGAAPPPGRVSRGFSERLGRATRSDRDSEALLGTTRTRYSERLRATLPPSIRPAPQPPIPRVVCIVGRACTGPYEGRHALVRVVRGAPTRLHPPPAPPEAAAGKEMAGKTACRAGA